MIPQRIVFSFKVPKTRKGVIPAELVRRAGAHKNRKSTGRSADRQGLRKALTAGLCDGY